MKKVSLVRSKKVYLLHFGGKHVLTTQIKGVADYVADRLQTMADYPDHDYEQCLVDLYNSIK